MFGNNHSGGASQQLAMDMAGGNPGRSAPCWRSPYSNPELEYVYLGSTSPSQSSPQASLLQPEPVMSPISNNAHILQPTAGNGYGFAAAVPMPRFIPVPGINNNLQQQPPLHKATAQRFTPTKHVNPTKAATQSQQLSHGELYPTGDQQFDDVWSALNSDLLDPTSAPLKYKVTPEDISMVEAYAPPGFDRSRVVTLATTRRRSRPRANPVGYNTWKNSNSHAVAEEAQGSNRTAAGNNNNNNNTVTTSTMSGTTMYAQQQHLHNHHYWDAMVMDPRPGVMLPNAQEYSGGTVVEPRLDFMDVNAISESVSSTTSPDPHAHIAYGYGAQGSNPENGMQGSNGMQCSNPGSFRDHHAACSENGFREEGMQRNPVEGEFCEGLGLTPGGTGIRHLGEPRWAEQLLNLCAAAIASKNINRTQHLMWVLNDLASVVGDANQRLAAYGLRALFCRITGRMEAAATFMRPRHHDQEVSFGPKTVHRALVKFHEHVPWYQNCYSVTSQTLLEVCAGKSRLHLIDIGVGKGIEWPIFIDALVSRSGGPPSILRMTMIRDLRREELNISTAKSVNLEAVDFMPRLVKFASLLGLHVEVNMVQKPLECVTREDLKIRDGETLAVVCQFRLHRLSEEPPSNASPARLSPRDEFLRFLYELEPHVFIQSDNDSDHCSHDFLTRFHRCVGFWWLCYESMEMGYNGRDPAERQIIEYEGSMMLLNTVACEGIARIERNEAYAQWQRRIARAGFVPRELSDETKKASQNLVANHSKCWDVAFVDTNVVSLQWRKQPTTFTSVWKTASSCSKPSCKCSMLHSYCHGGMHILFPSHQSHLHG